MTEAQGREAAKRIVVGGGTYQEAADATGIPLSTLQKTGARDGWQGQRTTAATYLDTAAAHKRLLMERSLALLQEAKSPAEVTAAVQANQQLLAMEKAFPEYRYGQEQAVTPGAKLQAATQVLGELVEYLGQHDRNACAAIERHVEGFVASRIDAYGA